MSLGKDKNNDLAVPQKIKQNYDLALPFPDMSSKEFKGGTQIDNSPEDMFIDLREREREN